MKKIILLLVALMFVGCTNYDSSDVPRVDTTIRNKSTEKIENVVGRIDGQYIKLIEIERHEFYYIYKNGAEESAMALEHRPDCRRCERGM